jgi:hypothetical protein
VITSIPDHSPPTDDERAQLVSDVDDFMMNFQPGTNDGVENFSALQAIWYLMNNPPAASSGGAAAPAADAGSSDPGTTDPSTTDPADSSTDDGSGTP